MKLMLGKTMGKSAKKRRSGAKSAPPQNDFLEEEFSAFDEGSDIRENTKLLQDRFLAFRRRLLKSVPWVAAAMCAFSFVTPFILLALRVCYPPLATLNELYLISFNVPLFGIAVTLMAMFLSATTRDVKD